MTEIPLGPSAQTREMVSMLFHQLRTHMHFFGATGSGKSVLLAKILMSVIMNRHPKAAMFVIDPLGGLAESLIDFVAHPTLCTDTIRDRFVYIEPANTDYVLPFNTLPFVDEDDLYYRTGRTTACFMRSAKTTDAESQPRLARWLYNCFYSIGALGYPPAAAQFLLRPGTEQHNALLSQLPIRLQLEWSEILNAGARERIAILDSTRNRSNPFFTCPILNRTLATAENRFDVERFIREKKIVVINLDTKQRMDLHIAHTLGSLIVNEIISTALNLPPKVVSPTILAIDEFQDFVGEDLYTALPKTRQRGLHMMLSHQSFDQLERGETDMRGIVWQARSRAVFCNNGDDADIVAKEFAAQKFDPMELKDKIEVFRQRKVGNETALLHNYSDTTTISDAQDESDTRSTTSSRTHQGGSYDPTKIGYTDGESSGRTLSNKHAVSSGHSTGYSETLVDKLEDFYETSSRTYFTFDEQMHRWARVIRELKTGEALFKFKDDDRLQRVLIEGVFIPMTGRLTECRARLLEKNFNSGLFLPREVVDARWQRFVDELGAGRVPTDVGHQVINAPQPENRNDSVSRDDSHFR